MKVEQIVTRTILTKTTGFLEGFDFTINPFRGCSFACRYCYAAKHNYSHELEKTWGAWLRVKEGADVLLRHRGALAALENASIYLSSVTDPYLPQEREMEVTRRILQVLKDSGLRRLVIQTRGPLILRDVDLLSTFEKRLIVSFSVPTNRDEVRKCLEPLTASFDKRVETIRALAKSSIRVYGTIAPTLPCDPSEFVGRLGDQVEGFIVSGLHDDGAGGKNLSDSTREAILNQGWGECLQSDYDFSVAKELQGLVGCSKVHLGRTAFRRLAVIA